MTRLLVFLGVLGALVLYFYLTSRARSLPGPRIQKRVRRPGPSADEFWVQVYDTDSAEEVQKIRLKFQDLAIQCFVYEQGKKDVFGNTLKHYGISVPRKVSHKAQSVLAELTL